MSRHLLTHRFLLAMALAAPASAHAQAPEAAQPAATDHAEDRAAIKALDETFLKAFNAGDAKALAETFTEGAQIIDEEGEITSGRAAILERFALTFEATPGATMSLEQKPLTFLTDQLAQEVGIAIVKPAEEGAPAERIGYVALYAKGEAGWKHAQIRDTAAPAANHHQKLEELSWMLGEWVSESDEAQVDSRVEWAEGQNFLIRTFTVKVEGKPALKGTERIGWDASAEVIRSWVFDEDGGFGESTWSTDGQGTWVQKASGVRTDGGLASGTRAIRQIDAHRILVTLSDRTLDGRVLDVDALDFVMVRTPPKPR